MPPRGWSARPVPSLGAGTWAAAGNRFTKRRIVPPLPIGAYTGKITGVPLTGGQASGLISGYSGAAGSASAPAPFTMLTAVTVPVAGTYVVNWSVTLAGTVGAGDADNFLIYHNGTELAVSDNAGADGTYAQAPVTITVVPGDQVIIYTYFTAGTAGSAYSASISSGISPLTLTVGPQGLGTTWYPAQVTLSTTTGALDTSTALVYLGIGGVPTMQVASVFTGNGTAALAIPSMQPGEFIIVVWTNGHPGDTASMNVIGTMDALTTGRGS